MLDTYYTLTKHPYICEKIYLLPTDNLREYPEKQYCISENEHPVLILQVGKVGSSAIYQSLQEQISNRPIYQVHNISKAQELLDQEMRNNTKSGIRHFTTGIKLNKLIGKEPNIRWKIIVGVREPISRWISDVFENIHTRYKFLKNSDDSVNVEETIQFIKDSLDDEPQEKWFNDELLTTFGVNIFDTPFSGNYQIIHYNKVDILIYRFENMQNFIPSIIKDFLNLKNFHLATANESSQKSTANAYKEVKQRLGFETNFLDKFYSKCVVSHFYTDNEIENFKKQWAE